MLCGKINNLQKVTNKNCGKFSAQNVEIFSIKQEKSVFHPNFSYIFFFFPFLKTVKDSSKRVRLTRV